MKNFSSKLDLIPIVCKLDLVPTLRGLENDFFMEKEVD